VNLDHRFISTTRAATLMTAAQCVELRDAHIERWALTRHGPHEPIGAAKEQPEWLAVAFVHEVRSAAGCVFHDLM